MYQFLLRQIEHQNLWGSTNHLRVRLSRRKLRSRRASATCTLSSHSAPTRPAQASSAAQRAHRAPCCAAATDHEGPGSGNKRMFSRGGSVHLFILLILFMCFSSASQPLRPLAPAKGNNCLACKTDLGWKSLAALSVSVSAWVAEGFFVHASNHKPNYPLQLFVLYEL